MLNAESATNSILGISSDSTVNRTHHFMQNGIRATLKGVDDTNAVDKISQVLKETFGCKHLEQLCKEFGETLTQQNIISFAYFAVSKLSEAEAERVLLSQASSFGFQYSSQSNAQSQLQAFLDSRINAMLVEYAIQGLGKAIWDGKITEKACLDIAGELSANNTSKLVNPVFFNAVEKSLRELQRQHPNEPIYHLSIGCGRGNNDRALNNEIKKRIPDLDFRVVGFDPQETVSNNPIVTELGGTVINRELAPGETYIEAIKKQLGVAAPVVLATERYSLHHMNRSVDKLLEDLEGLPLISVDHPITSAQRNSFAERTAMIAYDLLSNQVRTVKSGGIWIPKAMANPGIFSILYRREEDLNVQAAKGVSDSPIEGKKPPTWIISYPANIELSRKNEIARNGTHVAAALNRPGGRWTTQSTNP